MKNQICTGVALAALLFGTSRLEAAVGIAVDPVTSYGAIVMGGHAADLRGDYYLSEVWALSLGGAYSWTKPKLLSELARPSRHEGEPASEAVGVDYRVDSNKVLQVTSGLYRYHGPHNRLYASAAVGIADEEAYVSTDAERGHIQTRSLLPEIGYGYRWLFRHGGFAALGGALVYTKTLHRDIDGDSKVTNDALDATERGRVHASMRLNVGYLFE